MVANPSSANEPQMRRPRLVTTLLLLVVLAVIAGLFIRMEQKRRDVSRQLEETTSELEELRNSTQRSGQELAQEILSEVRLLMEIPLDPEPTVATIIDIDKLREANSFYDKAENGDHLIITQVAEGRGRAILYDRDTRRILDVLPVRIDASSTSSPSVTTSPTQPSPGAPSPSPETEPNAEAAN